MDTNYQFEQNCIFNNQLVSEVKDQNTSDQEWASPLTTKEETKNSTQNINAPKSSLNVSRSSKFGESQASEKEEFIKTIFEVTRINRKTSKVTKRFKQRHIISHCEHIHVKYYAKGMCKKCYFNKGQTKKLATKWIHLTRNHYACGMCKLCYLKEYHKKHDRKKASTN